MRILVICALFIFTVGKDLKAQQTIVDPINQSYHLALQFYQDESYAKAYNLFSKIEEDCGDMHSLIAVKAMYYKSRSSMYLFHNDAIDLMSDFIDRYPDSFLYNEACRNLADYFYQKRDYKNASYYYNLIDASSLEPRFKDSYTFQFGYSLFQLGDYTEAGSYFHDLLINDNEYNSQAKYYFAYIAYLNNNYVTSKKYFLNLLNQGVYQETLPLFVSQILHEQEDYEELIGFALPYSDSTVVSIEINKLIAEAYYHLKDYDNAIKFFDERYLQKGGELSDLAYYLLGQSYYRIEEFSLASSAFNKIVEAEDSLAQNAYYYLADSYLELGDKRAAQNAFESAAYIAVNERITEHANFNFAKLCYELGYPYADPTMILQDFINDFPSSEYIDEAYSYLVNAFLNHKDYSRAIKSMESSGLENITLQQAYQEVSYYRAVQLFNDTDYNKAIVHFDKALSYRHNKSLEALSLYWKGECYYRLEQYENSVDNYTQFQNSAMASVMDEFVSASYHIAYANYKLWDFSAAISSFETFVGNADQNDIRKHDTYARIGDSYYMLKSYTKAIDNYKLAVDLWGVDSDYASYQIALSYHQLGSHEQVIKHLTSFNKQFPKSIYNDDVYYRMGESYLKLNQSSDAITMFEKVREDYANSVYVADARMKVALIYYNDGENQKSIADFKEIVADYPSTDIAREAIENARSVYVDIGNVKAYADWVETLSFISLSNEELDSTAYESAELQYLKGSYADAYQGFKHYLSSYPEGKFKLVAHYYFAVSSAEIDSLDHAIASYEVLSELQHNNYTISSLKSLADLYLSKHKYQKALEKFTALDENAETVEDQLLAKQGMMDCYYAMSEFELAIEQAQIILNSGRVDESLLLEIKTFIARAAFKAMDRDLAAEMYLAVEGESQGELKAEAMYHLAYLAFYSGEYEVSKQIIFEQSRLLPMYKSWLGKSFIVLAKNYVHESDVFQATHTLDQLILNMEDSEVVSEAKSLRAEILAKETPSINMNLGLDSISEQDTLELKN